MIKISQRRLSTSTSEEARKTLTERLYRLLKEANL